MTTLPSVEYVLRPTLLTVVTADWLDEELQKFPLFIVMANGPRSFKSSFENKEGHLVPNTYNEATKTVQIFVRGIGRMDVHPHHLLPNHPKKTPAPNSISLVMALKGSRKGWVTRLVKVKAKTAWIQDWGGEGVVEYETDGLTLTKTPVAYRK